MYGTNFSLNITNDFLIVSVSIGLPSVSANLIGADIPEAGVEDLEFIEKLKKDKAYSVINYLLECNTLKFEDIRFLRA